MWTSAETASLVVPKTILGYSPRNRTPASRGAQAIHSTGLTSTMGWVVAPPVRQRAHVHPLQHPQEVPGGQDRADAPEHHEDAEQRQVAGQDLGGAIRRQECGHLTPEAGQPRQAQRSDGGEREDPGQLRDFL